MDEQTDFFHPRENSRLFGHDDVERTLLDAISAGRLHHSLLITGPKGIGKATFAYRLARHLLKPEEEDGLFGPPEPATSFDMSEEDPCSDRLQPADTHHLKSWSVRNPKPKIPRDITVADIRGLSDFYRMTSADGNWRVAIIDAADDMNVNAANALLKVLEEPPERSVIILLSHAPGRLLPTIRSRCHTVPLETLTSDELREALAAHDFFPTENDLGLLLELSEGVSAPPRRFFRSMASSSTATLRILPCREAASARKSMRLATAYRRTDRTRFTKCLLISSSAP